MHCKLEVPDAIRKEIFAQIASQVYSVTDPSFFTGSRVLLFSPHPDDDVIAAGLGLQHLNTPEIILHIAYCVAGYNSVGDMYLEHVPEDPLDLCIEKTRVREAEARSALELLGCLPIISISLDCHFIIEIIAPSEPMINRIYELSWIS